MYALSLDWKRCPDGVELFDYGRNEPPKLKVLGSQRRQPTLAEGTGPTGLTFRCKSARRLKTLLEVVDLENPLIVRFVNARDDEARAEFFARFGFLYKNHDEQPRPDALEDQKTLRRLLTVVGTEERDKAIEHVNRALGKSMGFALTPRLDGEGRLSLHPQSLLGLMLMEAAMIVERGARLTSCDNCGVAFLTGPTTGRRSHAVYCSDRCRVAAMRARNAEQARP